MKIIFNILLISFFVILNSCSEPVNSKPPQDPLIGAWVESGNESFYRFLKKSTGLDSNYYGLEFKSGGILIERKNSGTCKTRPITYKNYDGTWERLNDSIISLESDSWEGRVSFRIEIESRTDDEIKVIYHFF